MTIQREYQPTRFVDGQVELEPKTVEQAATIDDLIAVLQAIRDEHGNLELIKSENNYDIGSWTSVIWKSDADELIGAVREDPHVDDMLGGTVDGQTVKTGQPVPGKYLFI
jgi:hypothetical protein